MIHVLIEKEAMKYIVVTSWKLESFEREVNMLLSQGWKLQGGVSVTTSVGDEKILFQALTKEGE